MTAREIAARIIGDLMQRRRSAALDRVVFETVRRESSRA
jgi:hypothetical protein